MSEKKSDSIDELLLNIIERTDKILEETEDKITDDSLEKVQFEKEKLLQLMCERTKAIFEADPNQESKNIKEKVAEETFLTSKKPEETATQEVEPEASTSAATIHTTSEEKAEVVRQNLDSFEITSPDYIYNFNPIETYWEVSQPIFLGAQSESTYDFRTRAIYLQKGTYKIEYYLINIHAGYGLALFSEKKEFRNLIAYLSNNGYTKPMVHAREKVYIKLKKDRFLALINSKSDINPTDFKGYIKIIVHKLKTTPN